jgi:hypothetical protein
LLEQHREDALAGLAAGAVIHARELPRAYKALPRTLAGEVFAQWIDPGNLARLDERDRTIVLMLALTGFRVSSVVMLMRDFLELGTFLDSARRCAHENNCLRAPDNPTSAASEAPRPGRFKHWCPYGRGADPAHDRARPPAVARGRRRRPAASWVV